MATHEAGGRRVLGTTAFGATAMLLAAFAIVAAVVGGALYWQATSLLTREMAATLRAEAEGLAELDRTAGAGAVRQAVDGRARPGGPALYVMLDGDGRKAAGNLNRWPPELAQPGPGGVFRYEAGSRERWAVGLPLGVSGGGRVLVARDIEESRAFAETMRWMLLSGLGVVGLAGLGLGYASSRIVLGRIDAITRTTETIMAGDLGRRVPLAGTGDELDDLAVRLNTMLDRIEQLMTGMREISDNIAHDLKTPLNRLRNRAEAALRDPAGAAAHREGLERTIEAADDIIKTFNALLLIARLEAGAMERSLERFDLSALLADVVELYEPVAEEARLVLASEIPGALEITGNRQLVGQAAANLIDNAIKYGAPASGGAGTVSVQLEVAGPSVVLSVMDQGPGIPAEARDKVLRRFVRLDSSRSRPGTGLGLSLVAAVARLHSGALSLKDNGPGLKVELTLPRAGPASAA